jgi:branched-chain amino acid transport system substrate-binding protein
MKIKINPFLLFCLLIAALTSCKSHEDYYPVGCCTPLTGENAHFGQSTQNGIKLALEEINKDSAFIKKPIRVFFEDDKMSAKEGGFAINKLISIHKTPIILGPFGSSVVKAVADIANKNKTIIISASATDPEIKYSGDYVFRTVPSNDQQGSDIAKFALDSLKLKTAVIFYLNNDYGISNKNSFKETYESKGGKILKILSFEPNSIDFKTQLIVIKESNPEIIFFPDHYKESAIILKQAKEIGIHSQFMGGDGAFEDQLLELAGDAAENAIFTTMSLDRKNHDKKIKYFQSRYKKEFSIENDIYATYAYETMKVIAEAIKKSPKYNSESLKQTLLNPNFSYNGLTGTTKFDSLGEVKKEFDFYIVKNNKFNLIQK